ncbi:50S ribosomal protein L21 [Methyloceanibacter sp.]|jgi:large subunit ribosomal protein L21|uniref:50S ribosomal protein L21 n=1 Tax=Methyloceanibacter sp. TaxID=1965321 RepID=UPI00351B7D54
MFAVIRTGGKQYRVAPNDIIEVEKIAGKPGEIIELSEVLLLGGDGPKTGSPTIAGALVAAEVVEQTRGDKVIVFKKKRRKNYRRKKGHRQELTALRITEILTDGKKPSKAAAKPEPKRAEKKPEPAKAEKVDKKPAAAKKVEPKKAAAKKETKPARKPAAKPAKTAARKPAAKPAKKK